MIPSVSDVFDLTRSHLGDTVVDGGQWAKDNFLQRFWPDTYACLFRWLDRNANKFIRRSAYFNLPANTGYLTPAAMGIANMGEPQEIFDRSIESSLPATIAAIVAPASGTIPHVDLTVTANGWPTGKQVLVFGFPSDSVNGSWFTTFIDANMVRLNGCAAYNDLTATVGDTGVASTGSQNFNGPSLKQVFDFTDGLSVQNAQLSQWKWQDDVFYFVPANTDRQIKVTYMISGNAPANTGDSVGLDDSLTALSLFLGASAASSKGYRGKAESLFMRAIGNITGDTTQIRGGAFYEMAQLGMKPINKAQIVMPRYRPKRNTGPQISGAWF